jgi:hypothetical protein
MGVDDVGLVTAEGSYQIAQGSHVAERRDRLHEAAQLDDLHARIHRGEDLRSRLSAVDKDDIVPGARGVVARDDRVFVRAAVHEACDHMRNP